MNKTIKIPIHQSDIIKNKRGKTSVSCIVSDRWLKFSRESVNLECGEVFTLDVMSTNINGEDKKLCELMITKEELLEAISHISMK